MSRHSKEAPACSLSARRAGRRARGWLPEATPPHFCHSFLPRRLAAPTYPAHRHCTLSPTRRGNLGGDRLREEGAVTGIFSSGSPVNPDCHHNPHPRPPSRTRSACLGSREGGGAGEDIAQGCQLLGRYPGKEVCSYTRDLPGDLRETVPPLTLRWSKPEILKKNPFPPSFSSQLSSPQVGSPSLPEKQLQ